MSRARDVANIVQGSVVLNDASADVDFTIESNGNANMFKVDGGVDKIFIGHAADQAYDAGFTPAVQIAQVGNTVYGGIGLSHYSNDGEGSVLVMGSGRATSVTGTTIVADDDMLGRIDFQGMDGGDFETGAIIMANVDGTPGSNDMPGRLTFWTTADGAHSATERMRIISSGFTKIYDASSSAISLTASYHHIAHANNDTQICITYAKHSSYASVLVQSTALRAASSSYYLFAGNSDDGSDSEFYVRGDGVVASDGANNLGSGADYAEFFETTDGKAIAVGTTVVLENNKVRASKSSDSQSSVIGVVRPKSTGGNQVAKVGVVGNTACMRWMNKYLIDDYGAYVMEETTMTKWTSTVVNSVGDNEEREFIYETDKIPADGTDIWGAKNPPSDAVVYDTELSGELKGKKILRRKLNPDFDDSKEYVKREDRDEWVIVGLMGQVAITKGQKMGDRWIKMRDISDTVEEYMIR